jgi:hypothetical protein
VAGRAVSKIKGPVHGNQFGIPAVAFLALSHPAAHKYGTDGAGVKDSKNRKDDYRAPDGIHAYILPGRAKS